MTTEKLKEDDVELVEKLHVKYAALKRELSKVIVGQEDVIEQTLIAVFARGHALLVGVPGLAKTLLIKTLSDVLDLDFCRIQFTPDLMPADVTGTEVLDEDKLTGYFEVWLPIVPREGLEIAGTPDTAKEEQS